MKLPTISALLLLPLLAVADTSSTTTLTSTATSTRTIYISQVVASVTSTYPAYNITSYVGPTAVGTGSKTTASAYNATSSKGAPVPSKFAGAASSLNSVYAGSAGMALMIAAALL